MERLVKRLGAALLEREWNVAVAESCTGGALSSLLTAVPGSSRWFERGLITYSNLAKQQLLGVSEETLFTFGAVSAATVEEMVAGVLSRCPVQIGVAITGIAGPDGATPDKPVGTVYIAWQDIVHSVLVQRFEFGGQRQDVQTQAVAAALVGLLARISGRHD